MKPKTLRRLAERTYIISSKIRGGYPLKRRIRPRVWSSIRIQSLSDWLDKRAYIKENGQVLQSKEAVPYELTEETMNEVIKRFITRGDKDE